MHSSNLVTRRPSLTPLLALLAGTQLASAELITVSFTGSVTELDESGGLPLDSEFSVGESVSGFITFDDSIASSGGGSNQGNFTNAIKVLEVDIGDYHASLGQTSPFAHILETNNNNQNGPFRGDHIRTRDLGFRGNPVELGQPSVITLSMHDADNAVFVDNAATKSLNPTYDFSEFELGFLNLSFAVQGDSIGQSLIATLRMDLANFTVIATPPTTRALLDTLDLEATNYETIASDFYSTAAILSSPPLGSIDADFSALGDDTFEMRWQAPAGQAIEVTVPAGFTLDVFRFLFETNGTFMPPLFDSVPLTVEIESAGGSPLPFPSTSKLDFLGSDGTTLQALVSFDNLVPGETYRIRALTATGTIPASFNEDITDFIAQVSVAGGATIPTSTGEPDPGQWVRLVNLADIDHEVEIIAPDYRAAVIGDTIHLPMEVLLNPDSDIYDWNLAILPGPGLTISNPTVLETRAASVTDVPPGVREVGGSELTEITTSPAGGIVSSVSLSEAFTTSLGTTGAPHKILRFTLSGPTPEFDGRAVWTVGFADGLVGSGVTISNQLTTDEEVTFKPYTEALVFEVFDTIRANIRKDGANLVLEWPSDGESSSWDVYSFTDFNPDLVELWQEDVSDGEGVTSITFPLPADPRRFFTVVPAPRTGGDLPGGGD
ncbi:MAG: hypothetical protein AAGI48_13925 [Verrucomicrobiota bacterium]